MAAVKTGVTDGVWKNSEQQTSAQGAEHGQEEIVGDISRIHIQNAGECESRGHRAGSQDPIHQTEFKTIAATNLFCMELLQLKSCVNVFLSTKL